MWRHRTQHKQVQKERQDPSVEAAPDDAVPAEVSAANFVAVSSVDEAENMFSQFLMMFVLMGMLQLMWNLLLGQTF